MDLAWINAFKRAEKAFADHDALLAALKACVAAEDALSEAWVNRNYDDGQRLIAQGRAAYDEAKAAIERAEGG